MTEDDVLREIHRIVDARIAQRQRDTSPEFVRGTVSVVSSDLRTVSASLDGADVPTPGIAYPAGMSPVVGDDVIVMRRRDGFLLVAWVLGRD